MSSRLVLILVALALTICGIIAIFTTDPLRASGLFGGSFYGRQIMWVGISWGAFFLVSRLDYRWCLKLGWPLYAFMMISLVAVLFFGSGDEMGARRWLFSRSVQPSEFAKVAYILFASAYMVQNIQHADEWGLYAKFFLLTVVPGALIFVEPDLGTSMVFVALWLAAMLLSNFNWKKILFSISFFIALLPLSWPFLADYQKNRLLSFIDPYRDPLGSGYNVIQSQIAIGAGGFWGNGFLSGSQSQLRFLPARYTDFIFAAWCEQLGFLGGALIIVLFMMLVWVLLKIARDAPDLEGKFLASLVATMFVFQSMINIGMNIGVMPVTGIPLPFLSYGGSSFLINMVAIGLVANITRKRREDD